VGTRPDCLPPAVLALLSGLARSLDVWVELGVQTTHDETLRRIRRGHDWATARRAVLAAHGAGLRVAVHVILGLPGEDADALRRTAERLAPLPVRAIKIHNLHVVRGASLAGEFRRRPFPVYDEREYAALLIDFLRRLPASWAIARVNTDTAPDRLIAPRWRMSKARFLEYLVDEMRRRGVRQGDLAGSAARDR
jgi:radical SAM protein (TIGR01212 family)